MTPSLLKYYHVYGDSDDSHEFYYGKEDQLQFECCTSCKKIIDRDSAIKTALVYYKSRFNRLFYYTWDGVPIVSDRFTAIYTKYNMRGLTFHLIPKLKNYYVLQCDNIVRFDVAASKGFEMTKVCSKCGRPDGAFRPYHYKIVDEDEKNLEALTFYKSDIEFGDKHTQSPLLFATEDVLFAFKNEGGRIFFETAENGKSKVIDCKGKSK